MVHLWPVASHVAIPGPVSVLFVLTDVTSGGMASCTWTFGYGRETVPVPVVDRVLLLKPIQPEDILPLFEEWMGGDFDYNGAMH